MAVSRAQKVGQVLQQELASIITFELQNPRIGFMTVTEVRVTDDLRTARVYISVLGDDSQRDESLVSLKASVSYLRRELGRRVKLRYVPDLIFCLDDTLDRAERLDRLLRGEDD